MSSWDPHIEVFYGKYLDEMDNQVPGPDIILEQTGPVTRDIEPGEINFPTGDQFTLTLNNLNTALQQKYPLEYWINNSRTQAEGAIQDLQIYFRIRIRGIDQFIGVISSIKYTQWQAECRLELNGISELIRFERRKMLASFEIDAFIGFFFSWDKPLHDLEGNEIGIDVLQFDCEQRAQTGVWPEMRSDFVDHLGWSQPDPPPGVVLDSGGVISPSRDITRSAWVQIGEVTLLTRVRFFEVYSKNSAQPGSGITIYNRNIRAYVWHRSDGIENNVIPRGRFASGGEFIQENTAYKVVFHEPDQGNGRVALRYEDTPLGENWVIGCPYIDQGGNYKLAHRSFESFDVLEKIRRIINQDVSARHTIASGSTARLDILSGAAGELQSTPATGQITVNQGVDSDTELAVWLSKNGNVEVSQPFFVAAADSRAVIAGKIHAAINNDLADWGASLPGGDPPVVNIESAQSGEQWNGWDIQVVIWGDGIGVLNFTYDSPTSGGTAGGFAASGIELLVNSTLVSTSAPIQAEETRDSVTGKIFDAAVAAGHPEYTFTRENYTIYIGGLQAGDEVQLVTGQTGVSWSAQPAETDFDLFSLSRLPATRWRHAFWSDLLMYNWVGNTVIEALVNAVRQLAAVMYSVAGGKIAIAARDWHEHYPDDITSPDFDAELIEGAEIEPTGGPEFESGFKSYEAEHPTDIIEINNLTSDQERIIYADRDGERETPTLRNKPVELSNFRIGDLGVPAGFDTTPQAVMRRSPGESAYPFPLSLDDFLPEPIQQLKVIASTFSFPNPVVPIRLSYIEYPGLDAGSYVYDQQMKLWMIRSYILNPRSLTIDLDLEFKKQVVTYFEQAHETIKINESSAGGLVISEERTDEIDLLDDSTDEDLILPIPENGLILWLDASDANTIDTVTGNAVTLWSDNSPAENEAFQGNAALRPTLVSAAIAGRSAIMFDPGRRLELKNVVTIGSEFTVFQVFGREKSDVTSVGLASAAKSSYPVLWGDGNITISFGETSVNFGSNSTTGVCIVETLTVPEGPSSMRINGSAQGSSVVIDGNEPWDGIGRAANIFDHDGFIAEIIVYDRELSESTRNDIIQYLNNKWNI